MKTHIQLLALAIAVSIATYSQDDTLNVFSSSPDAVQIQTKQYSNPMLRTGTNFQRGISVDEFVLNLNTEGQKGKDIETLSHLLTDSFETDSLKVRAIFFWMTQNISYDVKKYHNRNKDRVTFRCYCKRKKWYQKNRHSDCIDKWEYELARTALIKKKGICGDYALLFYYLCDFAGIDCRYITGYAADGSRRLSPSMSEKTTNHAWNAVMINGKWYLMDVTWASGYCDKGVKKFTKDLYEFYYLTPPEKFIATHHPKEKKWQLLNNPLKMKEFVELVNK